MANFLNYLKKLGNLKSLLWLSMKTNMVKQKRGQILNLARGNLSGHVVFGLYNFGAKPPVIREHCANLLTINSDIAGVY